ncbi:hypothetical protein COCVIDRAFT_12887 [Bipolaris victoriae FI3]|uniref:Uncharacterized protein n=2 Tax=Bipolaris TaxID=33194 RepID=W6Y0S3_COCC2|nr:uncharacterized protein COCCADRAFT_30170 [Bipolaris zeicola 26-R-13]XP_014560272.1 hypothetical protein COCVIDRAFT_12887 [Bipolaris victoriae FI3]EUC28604.1 hypothetical protein COCCADRAFT_30170 [Bipolaris zeicola 26-R-13]
MRRRGGSLMSGCKSGGEWANGSADGRPANSRIQALSNLIPRRGHAWPAHPSAGSREANGTVVAHLGGAWGACQWWLATWRGLSRPYRLGDAVRKQLRAAPFTHAPIALLGVPAAVAMPAVLMPHTATLSIHR